MGLEAIIELVRTADSAADPARDSLLACLP